MMIFLRLPFPFLLPVIRQHEFYIFPLALTKSEFFIPGFFGGGVLCWFFSWMLGIVPLFREERGAGGGERGEQTQNYCSFGRVLFHTLSGFSVFFFFWSYWGAETIVLTREETRSGNLFVSKTSELFASFSPQFHSSF